MMLVVIGGVVLLALLKLYVWAAVASLPSNLHDLFGTKRS